MMGMAIQSLETYFHFRSSINLWPSGRGSNHPHGIAGSTIMASLGIKKILIGILIRRILILGEYFDKIYLSNFVTYFEF